MVRICDSSDYLFKSRAMTRGQYFRGVFFYYAKNFIISNPKMMRNDIVL